MAATAATPATPPLPVPAHERSTIEQVASAAGVSVATVSRALRGLPNVAMSTRTRVEEVARELNYRANPAASRLAAGRSRTVAIVVPLINSWYFSNVVAGAEAVCTEEGYDLLVLTAPNEELRHQVVATAAAIDRHVDGMIFVEVALPSTELGQLGQGRLGVVTVGQQTDTFPSVHVDNVAVGQLAAGHLIELGHRSIGVLGGQAEEYAFFDVPGQRITGIELAFAAAGLGLDADMVADGRFTIQGGYGATRELLERANRPTALLALSDEMAFGALAAARDLGCDVPRDVSVIGVDDHELSAVVRLTTIRQRVSDHGAMAARALLAVLGDNGSPRQVDASRGGATHHVEPVELVVRATTAPPASDVRRRPRPHSED